VVVSAGQFTNANVVGASTRVTSAIPLNITCGNLRIDLVRRCVYLRKILAPRSDPLTTRLESAIITNLAHNQYRQSLETRVDLSPQEFSLLIVLAQANGRPVHRHELLKRAWDIDIDNPRTVDSHVLTLRKKLGDNDWIETVRKIGYRLNY
jgi:two-component system, OmpR family, response regulator